MNIEKLILVLFAILGTWLTYYLLFIVWFKVMRHMFQQKIFALRDEWFDYANENNLFDNEGYELLRTLYNNSIHFASRLTFSNIIVMDSMAKHFKSDLQKFDEIMKCSREKLGEKHYLEFDKRINQLYLEMALQVVKSNPIFSLMFCILVVFVMIFGTLNKLTKYSKKVIKEDLVLNRAYEFVPAKGC